MQVQIPFIGGAYKGPSSDVNAQRCVNLYPELDQLHAKTVAALYPTPGLKTWVDTGAEVEVRGLQVMGNKLYAVVGATLYEINNVGTATSKGTINTSTGIVQMATDGNELMIIDGSSGYVYQDGALAGITDAGFPIPGSLTYQDGYFIVTSKGTDEFFISAENDATSWDALDFGTAGGAPDNVLEILMDHRELWVFGSESTEVFYNSGNADFPFERVPGAFLEVGIGAVNSAFKEDNTVFWLDHRGFVIRAVGYAPKIISTRHIEFQIAQYATTSDAVGLAHTYKGHTFYVLTFPAERVTWVYDTATQLWHERASFPRDRRGNYHRWRANCYAQFAGKHIVGDFENGKLYELDRDTYKDNGEVIPRIRAAQVIHKDRRRLFFNLLEIEFEAGVGLVTGQGSDPQVMLEWSDDGGHTWSNEHWVTIGKIGAYKNRARWKRMGRSRNRIYRVTVTDPVKTVMIGAYLDVELGSE